MIHVYKFNFFEENYYKYRTLLKTNVRKAKIMTRKLTFNIPTENDCFPCFPSSKYIDLTLGASGSTYTAPANGWFSWYCYQNNNGYIFVQTSASLLPN